MTITRSILAAGSASAAPIVITAERSSIARALLELAWPTIIVLVIQTFVGIAETYYLGRLGTDALAGAALVSPILALMTMMSNGGIGGGVASAVARAIGAGRRADAEAVAWLAVYLGIAFGVAFTGLAWLFGPMLYRELGGNAGALDAAVLYSAVVFASAVPNWVLNLLSAALRGAGDAKTSAAITLGGAMIVIILSPALIFGIGPVPGLGIAGAGIAVGLYYIGACLVIVRRMMRPQSALRLRRSPLSWRVFSEVMKVGGISAVGTVVANLTVIVITGAVGMFGTEALAGYGVASRLDFLLIPLLFGLGSASVTLIGASIGAGDPHRAKLIAGTGALIAVGATGAIGLLVAIVPGAWMLLFTTNPEVVAFGSRYLRVVAPFYAATGAAMMFYFASQGAGRMLWPFLGGSLRLIVSAGGGWLCTGPLQLGETALFWAVALGSLAFGTTNTLAVLFSDWSGMELARAKA